jgi:hypothetical protein
MINVLHGLFLHQRITTTQVEPVVRRLNKEGKPRGSGGELDKEGAGRRGNGRLK